METSIVRFAGRFVPGVWPVPAPPMYQHEHQPEGV